MYHNLCFQQKYKKISEFLSENVHFLVVKISVYLNRRVFVMVLFFAISDEMLMSAFFYCVCNK